MTTAISTVITAISTLIVWLAGKKFLFPYILQFWKWLQDKKQEVDIHQISVTKEINNIKDESNNVYEGQIDFLNRQIVTLEEQLESKMQDINHYIAELTELRKQIVELSTKVYSNEMQIAKLQKLCCSNKECNYRITCID